MRHSLIIKAIGLLAMLMFACSCWKVAADDTSLGFGFFHDTYVPNDSVSYYINCTVKADGAEAQVAKKERKLISKKDVEHGAGVFTMKTDTVINTVYAEVMDNDTFNNFMASGRKLDRKSDTLCVHGKVFMTWKIYDEICKRYTIW